MWWLCEQLLRAPKDALTLCLDECDIALMPVLRSMWMLRGSGHQAAVPTPGLNRKRSVFGALEWDTGRWLYEVTQRRRSVEFIAFMEKLMLSYPGRPLQTALVSAGQRCHPQVQGRAGVAGTAPYCSVVVLAYLLWA
jgi:hypothetical protein